jgi:hypothetical protein
VRAPTPPRARFLLSDELAFRDNYAPLFLKVGRFRPVFVYRRPRGGATVTLYERG